MGTSITCLGESQYGHFPAKCSVRIANILSTDPRIARWMMIGRAGSLFSVTYDRLNRIGSWKSSCTVAHWNRRFSASKTVMSIFGP